MNIDLALMTGIDIPFPQAGITLHQPTIKEIAFLGEETFFSGCEILNFSKDILEEKDKVSLENKSDFDILIAILRERNAVMQKNRNCVKLVLELILPGYEAEFNEFSIDLKKEDEVHSLTNDILCNLNKF